MMMIEKTWMRKTMKELGKKRMMTDDEEWGRVVAGWHLFGKWLQPR